MITYVEVLDDEVFHLRLLALRVSAHEAAHEASPPFCRDCLGVLFGSHVVLFQVGLERNGEVREVLVVLAVLLLWHNSSPALPLWVTVHLRHAFRVLRTEFACHSAIATAEARAGLQRLARGSFVPPLQHCGSCAHCEAGSMVALSGKGSDLAHGLRINAEQQAPSSMAAT